MPRCRHCGRPLDGRTEFCFSCGEPDVDRGLRADAHRTGSDRAGEAAEEEPASLAQGFVPIARFRNAAEAGYFADELAGLGDWPVTLSFEESFDAVSGHWAPRFVLSSPKAEAEAVTQALSELVAQGEPEELRTEEDELLPEPEELGSINWVPIVLTIAAGSAVLWAARSLHEPPKRDARLAPVGGVPLDLWEGLAARPEPWVQQLEDGGRREMTFDPERRTALIHEDHDGDGIFERVLRVRRGARSVED